METSVLTGLTTPQRDTFALVLMSSGIEHSMVPDEVGWAIHVNVRDRLRALKAIESYLEDNKPVLVVEDQRRSRGHTGGSQHLIVADPIAQDEGVIAEVEDDGPFDERPDRLVGGKWLRQFSNLGEG